MLTRLPALTDVHVHLREPGATHKEDWGSGTAAALAGGITTVLAMPNTNPAINSSAALTEGLALAAAKSRCDYALFLGGGAANAAGAAAAAQDAAGLKLYLDQTYGDLKLDDMRDWQPHFAAWPHAWPLCAHAEGKTMAAAILLSALHDRPLHICHVSTAEEIALIRAAKERGLKITCEVCPHHLFLCEDDIPSLGAGRAEVRPRLASKADQQALWDNLDIIDCFASDHAPHTLEEKDGQNPPPGYPGLETMLPLLLTAAAEGRLMLDDIIARLHTNPTRIFRLPPQSETYTEVDLNAKYEIRAAEGQTRCGWTPFEGWQVRGRVINVVLRGQPAYRDGRLLAAPGSGRNIRNHTGGQNDA
ncbi:MAG: amidohydrolase family protein [Anaerolineales bacterium]|nr:amidohydrolase family protein [Anaerolineales bacterium]